MAFESAAGLRPRQGARRGGAEQELERSELPGVRGMGEMSVELAEREIVLSGGGYSLRESLPFAVDSSRATAKFAKKTSTLKMSAPEM